VKSAEQRLAGSKVSGGTLTVALVDGSDLQQAMDEVRRAGGAMRTLFGQARKEFK
jgi:hypothetical protein